jgi:excisionase family DNA binding protein
LFGSDRVNNPFERAHGAARHLEGRSVTAPPQRFDPAATNKLPALLDVNTIPPADAPAAALLDVRAVAAMLGCSARHIHRLHDAGDMPRAVRLGRLLRWRRAELLAYITAGCPSPRKTGWRYSAAPKGGDA